MNPLLLSLIGQVVMKLIDVIWCKPTNHIRRKMRKENK